MRQDDRVDPDRAGRARAVGRIDGSDRADPEGLPGAPHPHPLSKWRWLTTRHALMGGSVLATVLALSATTGAAAAGAATSSAGPPGVQRAGGPPGAQFGTDFHAAVVGRITALSTGRITVTSRGDRATTVTYTSSTSFRVRGTAAALSSLKVGDLVAVRGSTGSDGEVAATEIVEAGSAGPGGGSPGRHRRPSGSGAPPSGPGSAG